MTSDRPVRTNGLAAGGRASDPVEALTQETQKSIAKKPQPAAPPHKPI